MSQTVTLGDFPPNPLEKASYTLDVHDEFEGSTLDLNLWVPYYLPHWSSRAQTTPHYFFENGNLVLQITQDQPAWCPEFDGEVRCSAIQTGAFAGPVGSNIGQLCFSDALVVKEAQVNIQNYTPQYGYFEIRAKAVNTSANHVSVYMIGYEDTPEKSGEIAIFEIVGREVKSTSSVVRYGVHPWGDPTLHEEFYAETLNIDAAQFHIYAVEWTPTHIDFFVDNTKIKTVHQSPAYPMQFMVTIYEHPFEGAWTGPHDFTAPYPKNFVLDYFRAYQPMGGYSK